ncbi:hypothetical protein [Deinococcus sp. QL22]|nr:hypothetical protein [Deinococcus sp. QL22]
MHHGTSCTWRLEWLYTLVDNDAHLGHGTDVRVLANVNSRDAS